MIKYLFALSIAFLCSFGLRAQQDPQFSQFMNSRLYFNAAYAGVEGLVGFTAMHRTQWAGYAGGGLNSQVIMLDAPLLRLHSGVGIYVMNDRFQEVYNNNEFQINYAYHLAVKETKLSFGIRLGAFMQSIDRSQLDPLQPDDALLMGGENSQIRPDLGAGIFWRSEKMYAGLSFNHLLETEFNFGNDVIRNPLEQHIYLMGGYDYEFTYDITISPAFLVKSDTKTYSFDLAVTADYRRKFWGGLSFRQQEAVIAMLGYSFFKDSPLKLGYAFDLVVIGTQAKSQTSHEFMLNYVLPVSSGAAKKVKRTPRFRH